MKAKIIRGAVITVIAICGTQVYGQSQAKRVLFLGNSFTYVNYLPEMLVEVAASMGDTLIIDSNLWPGYSLESHTKDSVSLGKIAEGNWDFVVLQDQSQRPSFPIDQVETDVFPYARYLDSLIHVYNPCGATVFYMTWGWKNGDATNCSVWPPVCTYEGMDSLLNLRYRMMADRNHALLTPVGAVWHYIRHNFPSINLYYTDDFHPEIAGTYAAACSFYSALFRKDPSLISFNPLKSDVEAANIRTAARIIVYDDLMKWHIGEYDPSANFAYTESGVNQVTFTNSSLNSTSYLWTFGDGDTSSEADPIHSYAASGSYSVALVATKCEMKDTIIQTIKVSTSGIIQSQQNQHFLWSIYPNPVMSSLTLKINYTGILSFKIIDLNGVEIQKGILRNSEDQISVFSLSDGLYILQLFGSNKSLGQQKFLKTDNR